MSGGWIHSFQLDKPVDLLQAVFDYQIGISSYYESDEHGAMIVSLDGEEQVVATVYRNSASLSISETAKSLEFEGLAAGSHEIIFGAFNNKKTTANEVTSFCLKRVNITAVSSTSTDAKSDIFV
jgi:hypothetical protein